VRTASRYLGPADGGGRPKGVLRKVRGVIAANSLDAEDRAMLAAERFATRMENVQRAAFGETASERAGRQQQEALDDLYDRFGMKVGPANPPPVGKPLATVGPTKENPSDRSEGKGRAGTAPAPQADASLSGSDATADGQNS
jgi:hypothetical protein